RVTAARAGPSPRPEMDDDALRRLLADTPTATLLDRSWLAGDGSAPWRALRDRLRAMPRPVFPLSGRDAVAAGLPPGPRVGALLREVRAWWLAGGCRADAAACRAELRRRADTSTGA
ncbi:MAG: CCA tRNA nucleotidyltransferase, partial [Rhodospirillales bacterium]|nr:CCA tRNA nucleotidyltransferase [Rhodospirillales bacterium]